MRFLRSPNRRDEIARIDTTGGTIEHITKEAAMPRVKTRDNEIAWMCCLDCGTRWVGGVGAGSRVCVGYEDEGCGSRRVVRETTATRYFRRLREALAR